MTTNQNDVTQQNWATNVQFQATHYEAPATLEQLQEIVRSADKVKVVGAGHSFNNIADTTGTLISLARLDNTVTFDREHQQATVPAGMTYIELAPILHQAGYALPNMASLPHITVIGACATATHGSGDWLGNLATHVSGLEMVNAAGEMVQVSRQKDGDRFNGMVVALGGLGVVTRVTLDLVPTYYMQQQVYLDLPLADMAAHFDEIMGSGYSVSLFMMWQNKLIDQVWIKQRLPYGHALPVEPTFFGATAATTEVHPVAAYPTDPLTLQRGVPGPWFERLPHFHIRSIITGEDERQSEYFVARDQAVEALMAVEALHEEMMPFFKAGEVRSVAADKLWLSTAYEQDCIGIHFSWYDRPAEIAAFLPKLEAALAPFQARPHWGKMHTIAPEVVRSYYRRLTDFESLVAELDPTGKFRNPYLERYVANPG